MQVQPRLLIPGASTRGNVIGPFGKPDWGDKTLTWTLSLRQKRLLFSEDNLPLPGGSCPVEHPKDSKVKQDDLVPVFFHEGVEGMAVEMVHALCAKSVIDMSPGSGHWAMACLKARVPYTGICFTESHQSMLQRHLISRTLDAMADSNNVLYDHDFGNALQKCTAAPAPPTGTGAQPGAGNSGGAGAGGTGPAGTGTNSGAGAGTGAGNGTPIDTVRAELIKNLMGAGGA